MIFVRSMPSRRRTLLRYRVIVLDVELERECRTKKPKWTSVGSVRASAARSRIFIVPVVKATAHPDVNGGTRILVVECINVDG